VQPLLDHLRYFPLGSRHHRYCADCSVLGEVVQILCNRGLVLLGHPLQLLPRTVEPVLTGGFDLVQLLFQAFQTTFLVRNLLIKLSDEGGQFGI
jgi:hypothetical protein